MNNHTRTPGKVVLYTGLGAIILAAIACFFIWTSPSRQPTLSDIQPAMDRYVAAEHAPVADIMGLFGLKADKPTHIAVLRAQCSNINSDHISTCAASLHADGSDTVSHNTITLLHHTAQDGQPPSWEILKVTSSQG